MGRDDRRARDLTRDCRDASGAVRFPPCEVAGIDDLESVRGWQSISVARLARPRLMLKRAPSDAFGHPAALGYADFYAPHGAQWRCTIRPNGADA